MKKSELMCSVPDCNEDFRTSKIFASNKLGGGILLYLCSEHVKDTSAHLKALLKK